MGKDSAYRDDYPTCARTFASLLIRGGNEDPDEVSEILKLQPTTMWSKLRQGRYKSGVWKPHRPEWRPVRFNVWSLSTEDAIQSRDSRRHIDWLLDLIKEKTAECAELRASGWSTGMSVFWQSKNGHGGPTLEPSSMRILADLGIPLWFDVYDSDPNEEEADGNVEHASA